MSFCHSCSFPNTYGFMHRHGMVERRFPFKVSLKTQFYLTAHTPQISSSWFSLSRSLYPNALVRCLSGYSLRLMVVVVGVGGVGLLGLYSARVQCSILQEAGSYSGGCNEAPTCISDQLMLLLYGACVLGMALLTHQETLKSTREL